MGAPSLEEEFDELCAFEDSASCEEDRETLLLGRQQFKEHLRAHALQALAQIAAAAKAVENSETPPRLSAGAHHQFCVPYCCSRHGAAATCSLSQV